jgi:hypothetical protein
MSNTKLLVVLLLASSSAFAASRSTLPSSISIPAQTALPVEFANTISTQNSHPGETVMAKTMQVIALSNGTVIPKGTRVVGHVVAVQPFQFDATPYAHQKPSFLSIHFDKLEQGDSTVPVNLSVRAIANAIDSRDARYPHSNDDTDHVGMMTLIGGTSFSPLEKTIKTEDGDVIGYNRKDGVFARLISSGNCGGTDTEQSISIFSPDACGAYGFGGDYLAASGQDGTGTFTLSLRGHSVKLYAGSTALLQVNESK